jgi:hypothetical protein
VRYHYEKHANPLTISRPCFWSQDLRAFSVCSISRMCFVEGVRGIEGNAGLLFNMLKWGDKKGLDGGLLRAYIQEGLAAAMRQRSTSDEWLWVAVAVRL